MRLDKFLQVSRLVRRRTLANGLCDGGHVHRQGRAVRASAEVAVGDVLEVDYGWRKLTVRVLGVPERPQVARAAAAELYETLAEERRAPEPPDP